VLTVIDPILAAERPAMAVVQETQPVGLPMMQLTAHVDGA
jgi:hypothetical protein